MKRSIIATVVFFAATSAFAQTAQQSTDSFAAVIDQHQAAVDAANYAAQQEAARRDAKQEALDDEYARLNLDMAKAKAAHANDYALADLKRENAKTDVVQSVADANRNYSKQKPANTTVIVPRCGYWGC
jgi:hypothetical protein